MSPQIINNTLPNPRLLLPPRPLQRGPKPIIPRLHFAQLSKYLLRLDQPAKRQEIRVESAILVGCYEERWGVRGGEGDQGGGFFAGRHERFLDDYMFACFQSGLNLGGSNKSVLTTPE